jgi:hypothetical protein
MSTLFPVIPGASAFTFFNHLSWFQNENRNHSCAFFAAKPQKTGLSAAIFWLRKKDFRFNPLRPTGFLQFWNQLIYGSFFAARPIAFVYSRNFFRASF